MKTAVDTSALLAIFNGEPDAQAWLEILVRARGEGRLVVCEVVFAEMAPAFLNEAELVTQLGRLGISFEGLTEAAAFRAGTVYREYRDAGGKREHLIPDFLIAAHAIVQADRLVAADRGYLGRYFAGLRLLRA